MFRHITVHTEDLESLRKILVYDPFMLRPLLRLELVVVGALHSREYSHRMPKGRQEQFFVELFPNYDQKKEWERMEKLAGDIAAIFKEEVRRQIVVLKALLAKNLYLEAESKFDFPHPFNKLAVLRIKEAVHDCYRPEVKRARGRNLYPIEVDPKEVNFSTVDKMVRIPYLGLVRHRHNNKILVSTDGAAWAMENVTSMRIAVRNNYLCLVIDCREDPSPKKKARKKPSSRKSSKWLE